MQVIKLVFFYMQNIYSATELQHFPFHYELATPHYACWKSFWEKVRISFRQGNKLQHWVPFHSWIWRILDGVVRQFEYMEWERYRTWPNTKPVYWSIRCNGTSCQGLDICGGAEVKYSPLTIPLQGMLAHNLKNVWNLEIGNQNMQRVLRNCNKTQKWLRVCFLVLIFWGMGFRHTVWCPYSDPCVP